VIIPSIRPTLAFVLVLLLIGASQVWIQVFLLTQGGPYGSTQVLLGVAYQQAFTFFQFSYGAAIASLMAVVVLVFSIFNIRMLRGRAVQ
jgi:ABC-type sugar transport system permease subunit